MAIVLVLTAFILSILILNYIAGRITVFRLHFVQPSDRYERIDYRNDGRVLAPYFVWKNNESELEINFHVLLKYKKPSAFLTKSFGETLSLTIRMIKWPPTANDAIFIKTPDGKMFNHNIPMQTTIYPKGDGSAALKAKVIFEKRPYSSIEDPGFFCFEIEYHASGSRLLLPREKKSRKQQFAFFAGPELGNLWMAIDPGTTATCIATGSHSDNITLQPADPKYRSGGKDAIIPSYLMIRKEYDYSDEKTLLDIGKEEGTFTGYAAKGIKGENVEVFQSIKKLLGYKDEKFIRFNNGAELALNGADLTTLLVQGVTSEFTQYIESRQELLNELRSNGIGSEAGTYLPKRIVVAIPNNFTASKTQDLVDCLSRFENFKEIRCISESEAVLCYYIHHHQELAKNKSSFKDETVMIFDMGGATINLTVADAFVEKENREKQYQINVEAKMGYGIGGDTIDYCLARLFFDHLDEYPELAPFNPFKDMKSLSEKEQVKQKKLRIRVKNVMEKIKLSIIENVKEKGRAVLMRPFEIQEEFNNEFGKDGLDLFIRSESKLYNDYFKGTGIKLLTYDLFEKLVFGPIREAIMELGKITRVDILDTVIFSGRSTLFP